LGAELGVRSFVLGFLAMQEDNKDIKIIDIRNIIIYTIGNSCKMRGKYRWGQKIKNNYNIDIDKLKDKLYNYIYNR
jgi:hypothetical protein